MVLHKNVREAAQLTLDFDHRPALGGDDFLVAAPNADAVRWLDNDRFVTANEGDWKGGSRGFTILRKDGTVEFDSGNMVDHIAIRLGPLADSALKLRPLGRSRRLFVAAPHYLARHGIPTSPDHLVRHQGIRMTNVAGSAVLAFAGKAGEHYNVPFDGRLRVDHGLAVREALLAGRGIAPTHRWLVDDLLASGQLEPILADYTLPSVPLSMLIVPERAAVARVRLLIDFLATEIAKLPGMAPA